MALSQFSFTKPGTDPGMAKFARDRRLAEVLAQQSLTVDPTQMAGGYAIRQTALNPLAKIAQALASRKIDERTDTGEREYQQQQAQDRSRMIAEAIRAGQGREAMPAVEAPPDELGGGPGRPEMPAQGPDPARTYMMLAGASDPTLQAVGLQGALSTIPKPLQPKWEKSSIRNADGTTRTGYVDVNSPNPVATFRELGVEPVKQELVNTGGAITPINPYAPTGPTAVTPRPQQDELERLLVAQGIDLRSPEAQALLKARAVKLATHPAPSTSSSTVINAGPKAFETELGKIDAEKLAEWRKNAEAGQATLSTVANLRSAIERGVYSGGVANLKTEAANLINGITGITPKNLPGSQLFNAEASKLILDQVKLLGANPSNADRDFLEKTIPRLASSPEARDQLIAYLEDKAARSIKLFQDADAYARQNHGLGGFRIVQPSGNTPAPYGGPERRKNPPGSAPTIKLDANGNPVKQ